MDTSPLDIMWFSLQITRADLPAAWETPKSLQSMIASLETLAQVVLIIMVQKFAAGQKVMVTLPTESDSSSTVGAAAKLYTGKIPFKFYIQLLSWWCVRLRIFPQISHLPGHQNCWADELSRGHAQFMAQLSPDKRYVIPLEEVFQPYLSSIQQLLTKTS